MKFDTGYYEKLPERVAFLMPFVTLKTKKGGKHMFISRKQYEADLERARHEVYRQQEEDRRWQALALMVRPAAAHTAGSVDGKGQMR